MVKSVTLRDRINDKIKPLPLPGVWRNFFGLLPASQFTIQIFGFPGSGKSTFALKLAGVFAYYGEVLYCNFEENLAGGTMQKKARLAKPQNQNKIHFIEDEADTETFESIVALLKKKLDTGRFKFCFIDSVSEIVDNIKEEKQILAIKKLYPEVSFVYLFHVQKVMGYYLGSSKSRHKIDVVIKIDEGVAYVEKNRYQVGTGKHELRIFKK